MQAEYTIQYPSLGSDEKATTFGPTIPWFLSSGWRLFGTFFLMLGLLMGALAFLVSTQLRRSLEAEAVDQNSVIARMIAPVIAERFDNLAKYVESFARRPLLLGVVQQGNTDGVRDHLRDLVTGNPQFDRAFVTDPEGVLWSDYPPAAEVIGKNFSWRDWFRGVSESRHTYVSKVYRRSAPPRPYLVAIAVPLKNARQEVVGYLVGQHTIQTLIGWLGEVVPAATGAVALIDHEGALVSTDDAGEVPRPSLKDNPIVQKALAGESGSVRAADPVTGEESLISYGPIAPVNWGVLTRRPIAAILAPIEALERAIVGLTLIAFAALGALGAIWLNTVRGYHHRMGESEARFRAVSDTANDAVVSADRGGSIIYFNPAAERIFGYERSEVTGKPLKLLMPERYHNRHREGFERYLKTGEARVVGRTVELHGKRKDGSEFPLELSLAHWEVGDQVHFTGVLRDVTLSKDAERRIRDLNSRLERRAIELEAANKELEAFSYSVSHDLRAPLRGIDGFSQALLEDYEGRLDAEGLDYLHRVRDGAQRMGSLIDDLLKLSRVTRAELAREDVDISELSNQIAEELQLTDPARTVSFDIAPGLKAKADARLLRAALENLIGNAWKFTSRRSDARITVGETDVEGRTAYFVKDNGAGFDMAYADKLFGAFQRLHPATEFPGTGIGLATVQRIIHKHGGRLWAEAEADLGATFFFTMQ